jgi:arylsulfatase
VNSSIRRRTAFVLVASLFLQTPMFAQQFDAPFEKLAGKKADAWAAEDRQVDAKLSELEGRFGKKPNIIYVLADDVGWGELGWQGGGKFRGTPTPVLDEMAEQGMRFNMAYAEPSCTPTRIAIMTGRHPVRTGLNSVLWPGQTEGLSPEEVTIAELLSDAGYDTAMWGKWHLGELPEHAPENQGFDMSYYGLWNGAPYAWPDAAEMHEGKSPAGSAMFYDFPPTEEYEEATGISIEKGFCQGAKGQERTFLDYPTTQEGLADYEQDCADQIVAYIEDQVDGDSPFFVYWATFTQQIAGVPEYDDHPYVDSRNNQASFMARHNDHMKAIFETLEAKGIAENTLVVWISDNGPMYGFWPIAGYTWLRGGKGNVFEGGVRVPAMAWWPGTIEPDQDPLDFLHVVDLYTTAARLGGVVTDIPDDRVTDGVDQTALLLLGEGHSRRNYMFHYSGKNLGAVRFGDIKAVINKNEGGGLPPIEMYNVIRDPGEKFGDMYAYLYTVTPFQHLAKSHMAMIQRFPHRVSKTMPEGAEMTPHD